MKRIMRIFLFFIIAVMMKVTALAMPNLYSSPDDSIFSYMQRAMRFNELYPQEKVYLHFDNTGYFKGETMWFQAYVVRADNGQLSDLSKIVYVELLDPAGNIIEKEIVKIEDGVGYGDIQLDSIIFVTGFYEVRAYTRYMTNWATGGAVDKKSGYALDEIPKTYLSWFKKDKVSEGTSYLPGIFSRVFPIFKKPETEGDYSHPAIDTLSYRYRLPDREFVEDTLGNLEGLGRKGRKAKNYVVNFYPEGGDLVEGMRSRVAFEVIDRETLEHQKVVGMVINKKDNMLAIAQTDANGRGMFDIIPDTSDLQFIITDSNHKKHEFELPEVKNEGCVIRMNTLDDAEITALLQCSDAIVGRKLGYVIMNEGNIVVADTVTADAWMEFKWRRAEMKPGVNQLTIFTADGHIQAERRFFICPTLTEENNITITIDSDSVLKPCGKVRLQLTTAPHARLSFSAMDAGTLNNGKSGDIRTYMLLGSDIRGFIAHPEYYFEKDDRLHRMAADTLMLVQGWRRYNWEQMTDPHPMEGKRQIIEDQQYVYGRLGDSQLIWLKKHPVDSVKVHVTLWNREQGRSLLGDAITDKFGNYALRINEPVWGDFKMDMKTMIDGKLKTFTIMVDRQFRPSLRTIMMEESKRIPVPEANLFQRKTYEQVEDTDPDNSPLRIKVGKRQFVTKTVKVTSRRRYFTDPGIGWFGELNARRYAQIYYDMEEITQDMLDRGEIVPTWQDFLEKVNPSFRVIDHSLIRDDGTLHTGLIPIDDRHSSPLTNIQYNNKNANVIIGNYSPMEDPIFIDDIKSIYISHNPSSSIYTIWIFPFATYSTESKKGRRSTWFHGYSIPSTFQMDDYSVLPPMEDFRRTLYWAPNLQTDVTGRTTVEFYNNSSCQQMYISAEGIGDEGGFIAYDKTHDAYKLEEIKEFVNDDESEKREVKSEKSLQDSIASRSTLHASLSTPPLGEDGRGLFQAIVIDKNTRERIPHAHVYVDADNGTMTNLDGQFVINARPIDQLRISFIGYETLVVSASELTLASDSIMPVLALSPAHNMLSEVVVEPVDQIIRRIISNYNDEINKKKRKTSRFYYRQNTQALGNSTEYTEAFFNANSALSIRNLSLINGRYAYIDHDSLSKYQNVNNFQFITQMPLRGGTQGHISDMIGPIELFYQNFYDVSLETLSNPTTGKATHYKIHFTPKTHILKTIVEATLYVTPVTYQIERYEGTIHNLFVRDSLGRRFPLIANFDITYTHDRKFTEVQSVVANATAMYDGIPYEFSSLLFNTGKLKEASKQAVRNSSKLREVIDKTKYNARFWKDNEIVKRTDLENSIIEMMEKKNLFSNYK